MIEPGIYKHYKGQLYEVIGIGQESETEVVVVIYRPLYPSEVAYWVRPLVMFEERIVVNGETKPRFERIGSTGTDHHALSKQRGV